MTNVNNSVKRILAECLKKYCREDEIAIEKISCSMLQYKRKILNNPGIYVFVDDDNNIVYYVGQSSKLYNRLSEHCKANIGASEGVVRFLVYLLDEICNNITVRNTSDVRRKEKLIKDILRKFIGELTIYIGYCNSSVLEDKNIREYIEDHTRIILKPLLNPYP